LRPWELQDQKQQQQQQHLASLSTNQITTCSKSTSSPGYLVYKENTALFVLIFVCLLSHPLKNCSVNVSGRVSYKANNAKRQTLRSVINKVLSWSSFPLTLKIGKRKKSFGPKITA